MSEKRFIITRTDLDHFFKQDYQWFDEYGPDDRELAIKQIYDGLLYVINGDLLSVVNK